MNGNNHHSQTTNYARPSYYDETSTTAKLEYQLRETEQLLEISLLKKKLRETERAMEQIISDIHGKAAKCNNDDNKTSNINIDTTMDVTTAQVRSSNILLRKVVTQKIQKKNTHTYTNTAKFVKSHKINRHSIHTWWIANANRNLTNKLTHCLNKSTN